MQARPRLRSLVGRHPGPVGAAGFARRRLAGARRDPVQDRPVQVFVDDLVIGGHGPLPLAFSPNNLSRSVDGRYVETSEIVQ